MVELCTIHLQISYRPRRCVGPYVCQNYEKLFRVDEVITTNTVCSFFGPPYSIELLQIYRPTYARGCLITSLQYYEVEPRLYVNGKTSTIP